MRLTQVLHGPPVFRFWKHFGAGLQRRQPNFKNWRHAWISRIERTKIPDYTIPAEKLPPGARVLTGEDLLAGHIDEMPEQLLERKQNKNSPILYDHPWPFNVRLDPLLEQEPFYNYSIYTRFFTPQLDCQVLTNTIIESDALEARPPVEPTSEHVDNIMRQFDWATRDDSILVRLPKERNWPRLNIKPRRSYGIAKERMEVNVMNAFSSYAQTLLAKYYHEQGNQMKLEEILNHRSLAYPHCVVPFERDNMDKKKLNMDLFIDSMLIGKKPLPAINTEPANTRHRQPIDIAPRSWRSLLPTTRQYTPAWSFALPQDARLHTIQISSRIKRKYRPDDGEMLARSIVHAFALTSQYARLQASSDIGNSSSSSELTPQSGTQSGLCSNILQDPLSVKQVNNRDLLDQPIVLQTISFDKLAGSFQFLRYQLNTLNFDDQNPARVKNQAWHSGPISELSEALRYYLDFLTFDSSMVPQMRDDLEAARLRALQSAQPVEDTSMKSSPEALSEGY